MFLILCCSLSQILLFTVRNNCTVCKYIMLSCYNPVKYFSRCSLFHQIFRITSLFTGFCTLYTKYWLSRVFCLNKNKKKVELFFKNSSFFLFYIILFHIVSVIRFQQTHLTVRFRSVCLSDNSWHYPVSLH